MRSATQPKVDLSDYEGALARFPVELGQSWQAGPHLLCCWDVEAGAPPIPVEGAAATLTDPPWGSGPARAFRTKAGLESRPVDFEALMRRFLELCRRASPRLAMEMGNAFSVVVASWATEYGFHLAQSFAITYYRKNPCSLLVFDATLPQLVEGTDDEEWPYVAVRALTEPGETVFDPCFGRGLMAEAAASLGRRFVGLELSPSRMAITLTRLEAVAGATPTRIA